jgi:hypothetical protein
LSSKIEQTTKRWTKVIAERGRLAVEIADLLSVEEGGFVPGYMVEEYTKLREKEKKLETQLLELAKEAYGE